MMPQKRVKLLATHQNLGYLAGWVTGAIFLLCTSITSVQQHEEYRQAQSQYQRLADALIEGRTNLKLHIPKKLKELENPYIAEKNKPYIDPYVKEPLWDTSYYKEKIYLYYGVVPAATLFAPFKIITKQDLDMRLALLIVCLLASGASVLCLKHLFTLPQWAGFLSALVLTISPGYAYLLRRPEMYEIAILSSSALTLLSLLFFLKANKTKKIAPTALGGILWILSVGCRPTTLCTALMPLLALGSKLINKEIKAPAIASACILAIAILLGTYNYVRFENPLEFGQNYVLTGIDSGKEAAPLHNIKIIKENLPIYLFHTPRWDWEFPYVHPKAGWHGKNEQKIGESVYGIITTTPIAILALWGIILIIAHRENRLWWAMISCLWVPTLILSSSATIVSARFTAEFGPAMILAATAVACQWIIGGNKILKITAIGLLIASIPTPLLLSFKGFYSNLEKQNPETYQVIKEKFHHITDPIKNLLTTPTILMTQTNADNQKIDSLLFPESDFQLRHQSLGKIHTGNHFETWKFSSELETPGNHFEWRFVSIGPIKLYINGERITQSEGGPCWGIKYLPKGRHTVLVEYTPNVIRKQILGFYRTQTEDQNFLPIGIKNDTTNWRIHNDK